MIIMATMTSWGLRGEFPTETPAARFAPWSRVKGVGGDGSFNGRFTYSHQPIWKGKMIGRTKAPKNHVPYVKSSGGHEMRVPILREIKVDANAWSF